MLHRGELPLVSLTDRPRGNVRGSQRRNVVLGAGRGEGTGNGDDYDLLRFANSSISSVREVDNLIESESSPSCPTNDSSRVQHSEDDSRRGEGRKLLTFQESVLTVEGRPQTAGSSSSGPYSMVANSPRSGRREESGQVQEIRSRVISASSALPHPSIRRRSPFPVL